MFPKETVKCCEGNIQRSIWTKKERLGDGFARTRVPPCIRPQDFVCTLCMFEQSLNEIAYSAFVNGPIQFLNGGGSTSVFAIGFGSAVLLCRLKGEYEVWYRERRYGSFKDS